GGGGGGGERVGVRRELCSGLVGEGDLTGAEIGALVRHRVPSPPLAAALPRLSMQEIAGVVRHFETAEFAPGAVIVRQGEPARCFYIVTRGEVEVVNHHPSGHDIVLGRLGPGEYFGEVGLLQSRPRTATVRAAGAATG